MNKLKAVISADGKKMSFIYSDKLEPLTHEGKTKIERVSNVEWEEGKWVPRMSDGTVLPGYVLREDALKAEIEYLEKKLFGEQKKEKKETQRMCGCGFAHAASERCGPW